MKLLGACVKEMTIAFRGYYFYIELVMAAIILTILLAAVAEDPVSKEKEFLFFDMPQEIADAYFADKIRLGTVKETGTAVFKTGAQEFTVTDKETDGTESFSFPKSDIEVRTLEVYDEETGRLDRTVYLTKTAEDMIRLARSEKKTGARIHTGENGEVLYDYYIQGYETERMQNLLYILHSGSPEALGEAAGGIPVRELGTAGVLNNRQNLIPAFVVLTGSMMGFFIIIAYIYLDKGEGVIKAFAVTPSSVQQYLLSKTIVIMATVTLSCSVITIPVMGAQPDYPLFYLLLVISSFAFSALGLLVASFFDSMQKAFGALFGGMMVMMIPALSYFIPGFDPLPVRFLPTYPLLQGFKEIISADGDAAYVLMYSAVFLAGGLILFFAADFRFRKTLTV